MDRARELAAGWPVLLGCFVGIALSSSSLTFFTAGVFISELRRTEQWSLAALSTGILGATFALAIASPLAGAIVDRWGVRVPVALGMIGLAVGLAAQGLLAGSPLALIAIQTGTAAVAALASPISFTRALAERFSSARGLALGLALAGAGVTGMLAPVLVAAVVADHGWRLGYIALGTVVLCASPIVVWLVGPRNVRARSPLNQSTDSGDEPAVALLAVAFLSMSLALGGIVVHFVPLLTASGVSLERAAALAGMIGVAIIPARLTTGALLDRVPAHALAAVVCLIASAGCVALGAGGFWTPVAAVIIGAAIGAEVDLMSYLVTLHVGLERYGRAYGRLYGLFVLGNGLSPLWMGLILERARVDLLVGASSLLLVVATFAFALAWRALPPTVGRLRCRPETAASCHSADAEI